MPAPKEQGKTSVSKGIKFSRKANMWTYFERFNKENTPDKVEYFNTEQEALDRLKK